MGDEGYNGLNLNNWREFFRRTNYDIFDIIEHAIMVAALDCPKDFKLRKGRIAEVLFSCKLNSSCLSCNNNVVDDDDDEGKVGSKESKVGDNGGDIEMMNKNNNVNVDVSNKIGFSLVDAEALTDEIELEREIIDEVLRIKVVLENTEDESESVVFESLRRLQLMALTIDILQVTKIGKAVNGYRRHRSKQVQHLARSLIEGWKGIADEWIKSTQEIAVRGTPESVNPSSLDEEGLPSPPLDDIAFLAAPTMELSQFFDGMDDDGNPRNCEEFNKNRGVGRKPAVVKLEASKPKEATPLTNDNKVQQLRRQEPLTKPNRPLNMQSGPGRPPKVNAEVKVSNNPMVQQKMEKPVIQRRSAPQVEHSRPSNDDTVQEKLEATKRKLQERYQQVENAKRQRTIQVMELHDLPKQGSVNKNTQGKFGNRQSANGRR